MTIMPFYNPIPWKMPPVMVLKKYTCPLVSKVQLHETSPTWWNNSCHAHGKYWPIISTSITTLIQNQKNFPLFHNFNFYNNILSFTLTKYFSLSLLSIRFIFSSLSNLLISIIFSSYFAEKRAKLKWNPYLLDKGMNMMIIKLTFFHLFSSFIFSLYHFFHFLLYCYLKFLNFKRICFFLFAKKFKAQHNL